MEKLSPMENPQAVFQIHAITKIYQVGEVEVRALNGVDLDLFKGEFVVLLGPSGSGKSTLLNILGGLDVPTAGEVYYFEHNLSGADDKVTLWSGPTPVGPGGLRIGDFKGAQGRRGGHPPSLQSDQGRAPDC